MKRSILSVCMLTLLCLLSCDINALNELLDKAREKFLDESKDNKDLNHKQENQEDKEEQADIIDDLEVIPGMEVIPVDSLVSVNAEVSVILEPIYYSQVKREIKEEDLVPSTECEKEAEKAIKDIENAIGSSGFSSLIENAHNMRGKYGQMRTELQDLYVKIQDEKKLLGTDFKNNREKRKGLSRLEGQLKEEIFNVENIMSKIDIAIGEIESAKALFEQAQKTLDRAITNRLEKVTNRYLRDISITLSRDARRYAESSLEQVESSSSSIGEATGLRKNTEDIIKDTKFSLTKLDK